VAGRSRAAAGGPPWCSPEGVGATCAGAIRRCCLRVGHDPHADDRHWQASPTSDPTKAVSAMMWLLFAALVAVVLGRFIWRPFRDPSFMLCRQGANMRWVASRTIKDSRGYRLTCLKRDGMEVMITFDPATVVMLDPPHSTPFVDFVELERWLSTPVPGTDHDPSLGPREMAAQVRFDPQILLDFENEIESWPPDQARIALVIIGAVLKGNYASVESLHGDLTVAQLLSVEKVVRRIMSA